MSSPFCLLCMPIRRSLTADASVFSRESRIIAAHLGLTLRGRCCPWDEDLQRQLGFEPILTDWLQVNPSWEQQQCAGQSLVGGLPRRLLAFVRRPVSRSLPRKTQIIPAVHLCICVPCSHYFCIRCNVVLRPYSVAEIVRVCSGSSDGLLVLQNDQNTDIKTWISESVYAIRLLSFVKIALSIQHL